MQHLEDGPSACRPLYQQPEKMAQYSVPSNTGKVRVAMFLGGKFVVWNGKHGKHEFRIICKDRKQAEQVAGIINRREHDGMIEVLG